ncbi:unnamed protein product, partial [Rotaria sp. Silwood2]
CSDMFENGSYLRRRKRFKLSKQEQIKLDEEEEEEEEEEEKSMMIKKPITKTSFLIDNLLANDTNTNTSFTTSSSSETNNSTLHQLHYTTDFELLRKLTLFNDVKGHHHTLSQQFYW